MAVNYTPSSSLAVANSPYNRNTQWAPVTFAAAANGVTHVLSHPAQTSSAFHHQLHPAQSYNLANPYFRYTPLNIAPYTVTYAVQPPREALVPSPSNTNCSSSSSQCTLQSATISMQSNNSGGACGGATSSGNINSNGTGGNGANNSHGQNRGVELCELSKTNLYIRGLNQNTTDRDLINLCSQYGKIISTKAIIDKNTNTCRGYGFVDFESETSADSALKGLVAQGIQAQMALRKYTHHLDGSQQPQDQSVQSGQPNSDQQLVSRPSQSATPQHQQEHDPTNLYFANLPLHFKEQDLENMLTRYGAVISTRILRDVNNASKGVGFARLESKEKCDKIISMFNGIMLHGGKDLLLVKFADSGPKKRVYKGDIRLWREAEGSHVAYEASGMIPNGLAAASVLPAAAITQYRYNAAQPIASYVPGQWSSQYVVQPNAHMQPLDVLQPTDPNALYYSSAVPQLATHVSALQIGPTGSYISASPHAAPYYFATAAGAPGIIHTVPISAAGPEEHPSNTASPEEYHHPYPLKLWYPEQYCFSGIPLEY